MLSLIKLFFVTLVVIGFTTAFSLFFSKWKKINVFISYYHEHEFIADEISRKITSDRVNIIKINFSKQNHNKIILKIIKYIISSDFIIVIPGNIKSFVDAEILLSSALKKPIIFIETELSRLPDTAYSGYPVFEWKKFTDEHISELSKIISYFCKHWKDAISNSVFICIESLTMVTRRNVLYPISLSLGVYVFYLLIFSDSSIFEIIILKIGAVIGAILLLMLVSFIILFLFNYYKDLLLGRNIRQKILLKSETQEELKEFLKKHQYNEQG